MCRSPLPALCQPSAALCQQREQVARVEWASSFFVPLSVSQSAGLFCTTFNIVLRVLMAAPSSVCNHTPPHASLRCLCCTQGQFDAQDGVAGSNAWIKALDWDHTRQFEQAEGQLWYAQPAKQGATATTAAAPVAAGWQRRVSTLTQVMIRNSGHMAPRDQPQAAQAMIQQWVADVLADAGWGPVPWPTGAWGRA